MASSRKCGWVWNREVPGRRRLGHRARAAPNWHCPLEVGFLGSSRDSLCRGNRTSPPEGSPLSPVPHVPPSYHCSAPTAGSRSCSLHRGLLLLS